MRKMTKKNKIAAVAMSAALVAVGGGAAYAYWSTTGGGNGSATASNTTTPVAINVTVDPGVNPGGPAKTITYTATNPNTSSTPVTLINPVVTTTVAAGVTGVCDPAWFKATVPAGPTTVLPGATTDLGTGTLTLSDLPTTNQDACKGATITVTVGSN
ncbi:hypothetical protein [Pseudarthrobacter sp. fls2-241-R2A-127]|uniref:hypothetical protein n=1 Tax=Pseudarthrobacter sp. fls2-241-R2A-127 TaxID=3040303 RepID=UPI0025571F2A|nr:hypothetical protein [Pseudarthrobacter sp. fls2-241-R2A-127]